MKIKFAFFACFLILLAVFSTTVAAYPVPPFDSTPHTTPSPTPKYYPSVSLTPTETPPVVSEPETPVVSEPTATLPVCSPVLPQGAPCVQSDPFNSTPFLATPVPFPYGGATANFQLPTGYPPN